MTEQGPTNRRRETIDVDEFLPVEDDVKHTAWKPPDLIASRISAAGGAARTVR